MCAISIVCSYDRRRNKYFFLFLVTFSWMTVLFCFPSFPPPLCCDQACLQQEQLFTVQPQDRQWRTNPSKVGFCSESLLSRGILPQIILNISLHPTLISPCGLSTLFTPGFIRRGWPVLPSIGPTHTPDPAKQSLQKPWRARRAAELSVWALLWVSTCLQKNNVNSSATAQGPLSEPDYPQTASQSNGKMK